MTQFRYIEFKQVVDSFKANIKHLGVLEPGRYRGFDDFQAVTGLSFELRHTATGIIQTKIDSTQQTDPMGILLSRQGVVIQEDLPVGPLPLDTNVGNGSIRYDLVIMEHAYLESSGGQAATYSIVKGPINSPVPPTLPNPKTQILIGTVAIPVGAANLSEAVYTLDPVPTLGDAAMARLDSSNLFQKTIAQNFGTISLIIEGSDATMVVKNNGNNFVLNLGNEIAAQPLLTPLLWKASDLITPNNAISLIKEDGAFDDGTTITIEFQGIVEGRKGIAFKHSTSALSSNKPIIINDNFVVDQKAILSNGTFVQFTRVSGTWKMSGINYGTKFLSTNYLNDSLNVEDALLNLDKNLKDLRIAAQTNSFAPKGEVKMFKGSLTSLFDTSGKGVDNQIWAGWALCNGQNGTSDMRGRFIVGMSNNVAANIEYANTEKNKTEYDTIGKTGGISDVKLTHGQSGLPDHNHPTNGGTTQIQYDNGSSGGSPNYDNGTVAPPAGTKGVRNARGVDGADGPQDAKDFHTNISPFYVLAFIEKIV